MENRRVVKKTDRLYYFLAGFLIAVAGISLFMILGEGFVKVSEQSTVYMVYGEDTCRNAIDAKGNPITCEEAKKDGNFNTVHIAHESLRVTK